MLQRLVGSEIKRFFAQLARDEQRLSTGGSFGRTRRNQLLLGLAGVTIIALLVRIPLLSRSYTAPDTHQYLEVAASIFHGGFPNNIRPPGYSLLLATIELTGVDPVSAVVWLQNLIGIFLPAFMLLVAWRFFSPPVGVIAGFLTAASPLMTMVEQMVLSDYLFAVALFIAAVLLAEAVLRIRDDRIGWRLLVLVGASFGVAALIRANGLIGLLAIPLALLLGARRWKPALRASVLAVGAMVLLLAPWCIHNWIRFGTPSVASESGISLYARAISWDEIPPSTNTPEGQIARSIYDTADFTKPKPELQKTVQVYDALVESGKSPAEAAAAMGALARDAIERDPGAYFGGTIETLGRYRGLYDPHAFWADPNHDQIIIARNYFRALDPQASYVPGESDLTRGPWQVAQSMTKVLYTITFGGLLLLLLPLLGTDRSRLAAMTFMIVLILGTVGGSLTSKWEERYAIVFAPMIWLLVAATATLLVRLIVAAVRGRPWRSDRVVEA